jgi:hypothetical protein
MTFFHTFSWLEVPLLNGEQRDQLANKFRGNVAGQQVSATANKKI